MMLEKVKGFWKELDATKTVSLRELVLGGAACTLAGVLLGVLCAPKKKVVIVNEYVEAEEAEEEPAAE